MARTLIAGFGNVLRGDDGFGVEVVRRLREAGPTRGDIEFMDVGTGGIRLAQELLGRYDRLIIVDAMTRGGSAGSVYVLAVDSVESATELDMHLTVPSRALALAKALGVLPSEVYLVGCEPAEVDELTTELSPPVRRAVDIVIRRIHELLTAAEREMADEPGARIARQDEVLQLLYWLEGEGFGADATLAGIVRFIAQPEAEVRDALDQLVGRGDVTVDEADGRYRLTAVGSREAGRRFAEEFAPLLQQGHGECDDPTCDCHTSPAAAADCRALRADVHAGH